MSFAIANNLLAPTIIKAIDLEVSPWATVVAAWNNS
jgi:hypothetical protein